MQTKRNLLKDLRIFDFYGNGLNSLKIYFTVFGKLPCQKTIERIDIHKFKNWINTDIKYQIETFHEHTIYGKNKNDCETRRAIYILKNEMIIDFDTYDIVILHQPEQNEPALQMIVHLRKLIVKQVYKHELFLITINRNSYRATKIKIAKPIVDLKKHYNDDFLPVHKEILKILSENDKSGLFLFHGHPGTGKSTYIRYLIHLLKKKILFLSPKLAGCIDAPEFTNLLIENRNSIFVIEDAEELIQSREHQRNSSISMLLNLTDGLLGECLGIQVIATFNTEIHNIDKALTRKGRLLAQYEFMPLEMKKAAALLSENGSKNTDLNGPMTLADIYNMSENQFSTKYKKVNKIGFVRQAEPVYNTDEIY